MLAMSRRYKSRTMQFGKPLALPSSVRVERCYAIHGKGYGHPPPLGELELVLINAARVVQMIIGQRLREHAFPD